MAKQRQPTNVLALRGTFKANPSRGRAREGEPAAVGSVGEAPARLDEATREAWSDLASHAHAGTLCAADTLFMEYAAKVWAEVKSATTVPPALGLRFEQICAKLGMTPADRSRVKVQKREGEGNPFGEFAAG